MKALTRAPELQKAELSIPTAASKLSEPGQLVAGVVIDALCRTCCTRDLAVTGSKSSKIFIVDFYDQGNNRRRGAETFF